MSIQIEASYAKKLGLPNYSSHSFMVTVHAEVSSLRRLETESARLYRLLQDSVDKQVEEVGFLPDAAQYGIPTAEPQPSNGHQAPKSSEPTAWACSPKQKELILRLGREQELDAVGLDARSKRLQGCPAHALDKKKASAFISQFLAEANPHHTKRAASHRVPESGRA